MSDFVFKPDMQAVSRATLARAHMVDLGRSVGRMMLKYRRRTSDVVDAEYNSGTWSKVLDERSWLRAESLEDFLIGSNSARVLAKVAGEIVQLPHQDYYRYRIGALSELIAKHAGSADTLLELGAGYGYNLFALSLGPRWRRLRGLDISTTAIMAGRQIAAHFGVPDKVTFGGIDLTQPDDPGFQELAGATVLTYFCLEQIPYRIDSVIENILRARPARVVNIEPAVNMLDLAQPRDLASRVYIKSMDYQTRLFELLDMLEEKGKIRVLARERMSFAPTLHNDGLLYAWQPLD